MKMKKKNRLLTEEHGHPFGGSEQQPDTIGSENVKMDVP